jgi:glycerol-3-phosphate dehydrogenase
VGGGNSAHVLIPFLAEAGHRVNLLTRRPDDWNETVYCEITDTKTGVITHTHAGSITKKSSDPAEVVADADIVILCMPVHQYRPALDRIAPFLNREKNVFVGTVRVEEQL